MFRVGVTVWVRFVVNVSFRVGQMVLAEVRFGVRLRVGVRVETQYYV